MPAVTTRFEITKQDIRKGRKTGWPVSILLSAYPHQSWQIPHTRMQRRIHHFLRLPYFRCHRLDLPLLIRQYQFLCMFKSRCRDEEGSASAILSSSSSWFVSGPAGIPTTPKLVRWRPVVSSPRICYFCRLLDSAPVRTEVVA